MFLVASHLLTRHRRLLGAVLLLAAVVLTAGWPALASLSAAAGHGFSFSDGVTSGDGIAAGDQSSPASCAMDGQDQWSGHPFAVPNPGQSHQGQSPPVRLALAFADSAWNTVAADAGCAVIVTAQRAGAAKTAQRLAPLWGSLQVREVRLQI